MQVRLEAALIFIMGVGYVVPANRMFSSDLTNFRHVLRPRINALAEHQVRARYTRIDCIMEYWETPNAPRLAGQDDDADAQPNNPVG